MYEDKFDARIHVTYDDVYLRPVYSLVDSRRDVKPGIQLYNGPYLNVPVFSANMHDVTGWDLAVAMSRAGGIGVLPRTTDTEGIGLSPQEFLDGADSQSILAMSVGLKETDQEISDLGSRADILVLDLARGDSSLARARVREIREIVGTRACIAAGNVATPKGALLLNEAGADIVKIGVGPGAACTTRRVAGVGVPQLTAIYEIDRYLRQREVRHRISLIADGGIKHPGDVPKAIAAGADAVMIGRLFASCQEAPNNGVYRGSSTFTDQRVHEGVDMQVSKNTTVADVMRNIDGGLRSAMSYCNSATLKELQERGQFIRITQASQIEGGPRYG